MKASILACISLFACSALPALAGSNNTQYIYVRSDLGQPWEQDTNEEAMDSIFGSGNWTTEYYETLTVTDLLSSNTSFIFLEGGDSSLTAFQNFVDNYGDQLYTWIYNGGRLLIMSAPNNPLNGADISLPDNVSLLADAYYGSAASSAYAVNISNPIFSGPNSTAYNFTGDYFSHGYFTGSDVDPIMQSNLNEIVLGQDTNIGNGLMVFGGMTTDNFQLPQPEAHALLENIIYYTAETNL